MMSHQKNPLLTGKSLILAPLIFFGFTTISNLILRQVRFKLEFSMSQYWPISIIYPKIPALPDLLTLVAVICLGIALWKSHRQKRSFRVQLGIIWLIVVATNLFGGHYFGFAAPTSTGTIYDVSYWNDAKAITDPINYVQQYTAIQPSLRYHSRVHPPLPVLLYYTLQQISSNPVIASLFISIMSLGAVWFLYKWLQGYISEPNAQYVSLMFGISAAFQIFSLATVDGVIVALTTGVLWAFDQPEGKLKIKTCIGLLTLSLLFTFGAVWLIPILFVMDIYRHKNIRQFIQIMIGVTLLLFGIYGVTGYSYPQGFMIAKSFEDSSQFNLSLSGILSYFSTRLMDIAEPILFLGPYVSLLIYRSIKKIASTHFLILFLASTGSFLGFIALGAYYTGETSRAALFLIPPTLAIVGPYLDQLKPTIYDKQILFGLVLGQTILMQLFCYYYF